MIYVGEECDEVSGREKALLRGSMQSVLDREGLKTAFQHLGEHLARRGVFLEIAVYGGSAIMLQFAWRRSTQDVDAVVRPGFDEAALATSVAHVAGLMGLAPDWLNNAVGMFTPLREDASLFEASGSFPEAGPPGLRVLLAKPHYLLAMKLKALSNMDRGDKDLSDARNLASELKLSDIEALRRLYRSVHADHPPADVERQLSAVLRMDEP